MASASENGPAVPAGGPGEATGAGLPEGAQVSPCVVCLMPIRRDHAVLRRGRVYCAKCAAAIGRGEAKDLGAEPLDIAGIAESEATGEPVEGWLRTREALRAVGRRARLDALLGGALLVGIGLGAFAWTTFKLPGGRSVHPWLLALTGIDLVCGIFAGYLLSRRGGGAGEGAMLFALGYLLAHFAKFFASLTILLPEGAIPPQDAARLATSAGGLLLAVAAGSLLGWGTACALRRIAREARERRGAGAPDAGAEPPPPGAAGANPGDRMVILRSPGRAPEAPSPGPSPGRAPRMPD